jgi:DNA-binding LacI/PurR family transcriptional regulator
MDIRTFAKLVGVSIATVSRAFSGNGRISPETRQHILKMAEEKGFVPNVHARRLSSQESAILGIFYSFSSEPVFDYYNMELAQELAKASVRQGYTAQLELTSDDARQEERLLNLAATGAIDGVVLVVGGADRARELLPKITQCPCVVIANFPWPQSAPVAGSIFIDFRSGIEQAILRLRDLGHSRIGYIRGMIDETKHKAYLAAMKKADLTVKPGWVHPGYKSFSDGEAAARVLVKRRVTAILCATDILALGVMHAAQEQGVRVPEDLAVVGMDDLALSAFTTPGLSSIGVPREHVGEVTVESLTRAIRDKRSGQVKTSYYQTVHPQLVERRSLGTDRT